MARLTSHWKRGPQVMEFNTIEGEEVAPARASALTRIGGKSKFSPSLARPRQARSQSDSPGVQVYEEVSDHRCDGSGSYSGVAGYHPITG